MPISFRYYQSKDYVPPDPQSLDGPKKKLTNKKEVNTNEATKKEMDAAAAKNKKSKKGNAITTLLDNYNLIRCEYNTYIY